MRERGLQSLARRWWAGELGAAGKVLDVLLAPAEALYRGGVAARNGAYGAGLLRQLRAGIPVISVGNIAVGGTGKTPFAQYIARLLHERGARPAILHGGYAADEPELHRHWSAQIPVIVDADRVRGARTARARGADVAVLDDGFQHRRLQRDLDIVLLAAERWGATHLLPRGPWREPRSALRRAHLIVTTRKTATAAYAAEVRRALVSVATAPVISVYFEPAGWVRPGAPADPPPDPPRDPVVAVAALAEPELFAGSARLIGTTVRAVLGFPDHHAYTAADAERILRHVDGAAIVTTEKDWIKLQTLLPPDRVWLLRQRVRVEHGAGLLAERLDDILRERVPGSRAR
jgi:tetraacyldisaccharide 4'-kinase